jgi:hypothetical protein
LMHGIYVTKDDLFLCNADAWNHFVLVNLLVSSNGASDGLLPVTIIIILYKSPRRPKLQQQQPPRIPVLPDWWVRVHFHWSRNEEKRLPILVHLLYPIRRHHQLRLPPDPVILKISNINIDHRPCYTSHPKAQQQQQWQIQDLPKEHRYHQQL